MTETPTRYAMRVITQAREAHDLTSADMVAALISRGYGDINFHKYRAAEDGRTVRVPFDLVDYCAAILDIDPSDLFSISAEGRTEPHTDAAQTTTYPAWDDLEKDAQDHWLFKIGEQPSAYTILRGRGTLDEYISSESRALYRQEQ